MIVIKQGKVKDKTWREWVGASLKCKQCGCRFQLEETDDMYYGMGNCIIADCPTCGYGYVYWKSKFHRYTNWLLRV